MSKDESVRSDNPEEPTATVNANNVEDTDLDGIAGGGVGTGLAGAGALMAVGETGVS